LAYKWRILRIAHLTIVLASFALSSAVWATAARIVAANTSAPERVLLSTFSVEYQAKWVKPVDP